MTVDAPLVATFHCYSENVFSNNLANFFGARRRLNRLHVRIAVSQAAAWTGRRFFGGTYRIIPNGVDVPASRAGAARGRGACDAGRPLRIAFIGQAVERKGLPVLLRAFEALREHVPATLRRRRRRRRGARAAHARHARRRRARQVQRRGEAARARRGRRAVRAVARRRELRHGADRGVRGRHAGRRVGHRGLPRRRRRTASTACSCRAATRPRSPRRCATSRSTPPAAPRSPPRRPSRPRATPGRASPPRSSSAYEDAIALHAAARRRRAAGPARPRARRRRAGARAAAADARARAAARRATDASRPGARMARRLAIGAVGIFARGARGHRAAAHRHRPGRPRAA